MWISTPTGSKVPFIEIANYTIERGDVAINHLNGQREIQITADLKSTKESATDVMGDIKTRIMPQIISKYPTVTASYEGQNREAGKTQRSVTKVGLIIILSFIEPAFLEII